MAMTGMQILWASALGRKRHQQYQSSWFGADVGF